MNFRRTMVAMLLLAAAVPVIDAVPAAAALPGIYRVASVNSGTSVSPTKGRIAQCRPGDFVIGGGGWADDFGANQVMLTHLVPFHGGTSGDSYYAEAAAPPGSTVAWNLTAYAICAPGLDPAYYRRVEGPVKRMSDTFTDVTASCPGSTLAVGGGAAIEGGRGEVGLQLVRLSGPRDISRATGREDASGFRDEWTLQAYALCYKPSGLTLTNTIVPGPGLDLPCPLGKVHSFGGGGGLVDGGPVFLNVLYPFDGLPRVQVFMTGSIPGGMVIQRVCG
jgi:hypothetical protein